MDTIKVLVKTDNLVTQLTKRDGDAAYDIKSNISLSISPNKVSPPIGTGIYLAMKEDRCARLISRSGLAVKGITVEGGLIDSSYRGEVKVILHNCSDHPFTVNDGDRIAQMKYEPVLETEHVYVYELPDSTRGESGFGSTGLV